MRVAIIADTHAGVRNDSPVHLDVAKRFYDDVLFPEMRRRRIDQIVHLGDVLDRRKYVNIYTARRLREDFFEPVARMGAKIRIICGNHDVYFRDTLETNSIQELAGHYDNVDIVLRPTHVTYGDLKVLMIPWITEDNEEESLRMIAESDAPWLMGHLALLGFDFLKGVPAHSGMDPETLERYEQVLSGHYHHRQSRGNVLYTGCVAEQTWSDYHDQKGFHVLDTDDRSLEFVPNPDVLHYKLVYDDEGKTLDEVLDFDSDHYSGKIVKLIVRNKTNPYHLDHFVEKLESAGLASVLQIVEDHRNVDESTDEESVQTEDTLRIFREHVEKIPEDSVNKTRLDQLITELYTEASSQ